MIRRETRIISPPLTPELRFHGAAEFTSIWSATEIELAERGLPPPFWAFAWAGGQALARFILDHPETVRGRRVFALAAGAGLEAIAAAKSGAAVVVANDIDRLALRAAALNATENGVSLELDARDWLAAETPPPANLVLAADIFYERAISDHLSPLLAGAVRAGAEVWIADAGRPYRPKVGLEQFAAYDVPTPVELEDTDTRRAELFRLTAI